MNHTVNILPYVVVDFVWINWAGENARLCRPAFFLFWFFFNAFWWLNHVAAILFPWKIALPELSAKFRLRIVNKDTGNLTS